jgi:6-phosphogluconolactonase
MTGRPDIETKILVTDSDGHTASLFPGTPVLGERHKWVVAGAEKRQILGRFLQRDYDLPSARLAAAGKMRLFADAAAVGRSAP